MPKESVIIAKLFIESNSQVCHFQMKIPRGVKRIVGIETGVNFQSLDLPRVPPVPVWQLPIAYKSKFLLGELKLQTFENANIFYSQEVALDQNISNSDFTSQFFIPRVYTHQIQNHEDPISLDGNVTVVQGLYKNALSLAIPYAYSVQVYVWLES